MAPGRNRAVLDLLARFGARVSPVELSGDEDARRATMAAAAPRPIDVGAGPPAPVSERARGAGGTMTVRQNGRVVLMGGVGMLGGKDLALPYPWIMRNS